MSKYLIITYSILILILFSSSAKSQSQLPTEWQFIDYCLNDSCNSTNWYPISNIIVTIPELPNCNIRVGGYMRICGNQIEIAVMGYKIENFSQDCMNDFNNLTDEEKNKIQVSLYRAMTLKIFNDEYNSLPAHLKFQLECGFGGKVYTTGSFASCSKSCFFYSPSTGVFESIVVNCSEYCCILKREICFDKITNQVVVNETWTNNVIGPNSCFPPMYNCFGAFATTDCFPLCETE